MRFDVNRLSVLAGLPVAKSQRLSEASNRSLDDEKTQSIEGEADHRFGSGQLAEERGSDENLEEDADKAEETVYEIDEKDLKEELMRLRRMTRRKSSKNIQEAQLKSIIEQEVQNVFKDLEEGKLDLNTSTSWVYGNNKPRNSRKGRIARGFKSIGFK